MKSKYKRYECKRCLRKLGLARIVNVVAWFAKGQEEFNLCVDCYKEIISLKIDQKTNPIAIQKRLKKKMW
jgi:DNA-directed RNA polymerase subunit RPC12/RpoP